MNMKTSGDKPTSAVIVLALGLLIAKNYVDQQYTSRYSTEHPFVEDVTLVDAHQGRLLERSPGGSSLSGHSMLDASSKHAHELGSAAERQALAQHAPRSPVASDSMTTLWLVVFAVLGVAMLRVDHDEMIEETYDPPKPEAATAEKAASVPSKRETASPSGRVFGIIYAIAVLTTAVNFWVLKGSFASVEVADSVSELQALAHLASSQRSPVASDSMTTLWLAVFAVVGVAMIRVDHDEMIEEMNDPAKPEVATAQKAASVSSKRKNAPPSGRVFGIIGAIAVLTAAVNFWVLKSSSAYAEVADSISELQALAQLASSQRSPVASDLMVTLGLAVFAVLGVAVLRVDHDEMIEETNDPPKPEVATGQKAASVPTKKEGAYHSGRVFGIISAIAVLSVAMSFWVLKSSFAYVEVADSISELQALAQLASSQRSPVASDSMVTFGLAVFAILGVAVLRVDHDEMIEETNDAPKPEVATAQKAASVPPKRKGPSPSGRVFGIVGAIASLTAALSFWVLRSSSAYVEVADSVSELQALAHLASFQTLPVASDSMVTLGLAVFAILGVAVLRLDHDELIEETNDPPKLEVATAQKAASVPSKWEGASPSGRVFGIIGAFAVLTAAVSFWVLKSSFAYVGVTDSVSELQALAQLASSQRSPVASDSMVTLGLAVFAILGVAVLRVDHDEMIEETSDPPKPEVANAQKAASVPSKREGPCPSGRVFGIIGAIAVLTAAGSFWVLKSSFAHVEVADSISELQALAQFASQRMPVASDSMVTLGLAVFTVLGVAVLRVDHEEMIEETNNPPKPEVATAQKAASVQSKRERASPTRRVFGVIGAIVVLTAAATFWVLKGSFAHVEVADSASELQALAHRTSAQRTPVVPDCLVMLALAASTVLGAAVLRADHNEMVEESQDSPRPEAKGAPKAITA